MTVKILLLAFLFFGATPSNGARILAIFPFETRNHVNVLQPIVEALADKGHRVDVVGYFPLRRESPNIKKIITFPATKNPQKYDVFSYQGVIGNLQWITVINEKVCDSMGHPDVLKLIKNPPNDPPYDLLIVHIIYGSPCYSAIGVAWNIPVVGVITTMLYPTMLRYLNVPLNLASMSRNYYSYKENMNFWDRVDNFVTTMYYFYCDAMASGYQDYYIRKYLGPDMPSYRVIDKSYSLILSNSHYLFHGVKAQPPALIEIGGINVKNDSSQFDTELKKVLDESKDGFVYFSFGSLVVLESLKPEIIERFYTAIRMISPVRVILRSANPQELPKNVPSNVFTFNWVPQQKLLQHPNIKAFVTHGGALGMQEAIYSKVPMICVPFFAEQFTNCDISAIKNISLHLNTRTAEQKEYNYVFTEILTNSFYKKSIDKFSDLYFDRPLSPRDAVTYWIEYVIRHGKNVLRTQGLDLEWWQLELLDVFAFFIACILTILFVVVFIGKKIFKYCKKRLRLPKKVGLNKKFK